MKTMKRSIVNWMLCGIVSLWMFSSCEDYDFKDIPDPEIPEDMTPGLKLSRNEIMIDAMGNAQGFELRSIGGGWSISLLKKCHGFLIMNRNQAMREMLSSVLLYW